MRVVLFKRFISPEYRDTEAHHGRTYSSLVEGTGIMAEEFTERGLFHAWGVSYIESSSGIASYSVALVETSEGLIEEVLPPNIKFTQESEDFRDEVSVKCDFCGHEYSAPVPIGNVDILCPKCHNVNLYYSELFD